MSIFVCISLALATPPPPAEERPAVVIVVGTPGQPEFGSQFRQWADQWQDVAGLAGAEVVRIGDDAPGDVDDRERLRGALERLRAEPGGPLWLVLVGHGTWDGRVAKFNLRGPDLTDAQLSEWLAPIERPVAVLDCSSASGPFLNRLSHEGRVVVTATRSGDEQNFARFGAYLAGAVADPAADLDKDGQTSLLEAFLTASGRLTEFYRTKSRLATEHPLIDDNGDGLGTPADWFRGVHATKRARDGAELDGVRAQQLHLVLSDRERSLPPEVRARRDALERAIAELREAKGSMEEADYFAKLEPLMVELARLYRRAGLTASGGDGEGR